MPVVPHCIGRHFHGHPLGTDDDEAFWVEGTLALLRRCDAAIFIGEWSKSPGSLGEYAEAQRHNIPSLDLAGRKMGSESTTKRLRAFVESVRGGS
jgi:hypothetical protein